MYKAAAGMCVATALFVCGASGYPVPPSSQPRSNGVLVLTSNGATISRFAAGSFINVQGSGYQANTNLTVAGYSDPVTVAEITADANGAFSRTFQMPANYSGTHTLTAIGTASNGDGRVLSARVVITRAAASGALARTGFNVARWTAMGVASLILGLVLVRSVAFRRRLLPVR